MTEWTISGKWLPKDGNPNGILFMNETRLATDFRSLSTMAPGKQGKRNVSGGERSPTLEKSHPRFANEEQVRAGLNEARESAHIMWKPTEHRVAVGL